MSENSMLFLVFLAAVCHAIWNAIIKKSQDPLKNIALMQLMMGSLFLPLIFFIPMPNKEAWLFLFISVVIHTAYFTLLGLAYRKGALSIIYPVARGLAPLIIFILTVLFLDQHISFFGGLGIILITGGIIFNSFKNFDKNFFQSGLAIAFLVSLSVVGYSIADGIGSRVSNNPIHYIVWLFALDGWIFLLLMQITYGWFWNHFTKKDILEIGFGSLIAILGYGIVIYTMAYISFAYVSAIRETSVILAALIGIFYLKESGKFFRIISAIIVFIGIYFIYQN